MTRVFLVGVDNERGRGGKVLSARLDLIRERTNDSDSLPHLVGQFQQLLTTARHKSSRLLASWHLSDAAERLQASDDVFSIDEPFFSGPLEQNSYGVALVAGYVQAALWVREGNEELVGTGTLDDKDGFSVGDVDEQTLNDKAISCQQAGMVLLCPPGQSAQDGASVTLPQSRSLESAVLLLGGIPLLEALVRNCRASHEAIRLVNLFCESHQGTGTFPSRLSQVRLVISETLRRVDTDLRLMAIAKLASLGSCASLASEFEQLLECVTGAEPDESSFEDSLANSMQEVFDGGVKEQSGELLSAVAWLLMAVRWVFPNGRLADRLSTAGAFFRELLNRAQSEEFGKAERFVLRTLACCGLRSEALVAGPNAGNDIARIAAEEPSSKLFAIYREPEFGASDIHASALVLDRISYEVDVHPPMELFDFDRARAQSFAGVIAITLQAFDVKIRWRDGLGIFPPSIDTLAFVGDLVSAFESERADSVTSIVDIGCGTGVLGLIGAKRFPKLNEVHFIDIEPGVRDLLSANVLANWSTSAIHLPDTRRPVHLEPGKGCPNSRVPFFQGDYVDVEQDGRIIRLVFHNGSADAVLPRILSDLPGGRFSIAYATPPYLPMDKPLPVSIWRAAAGTGLLKWVVSSAGSFARELYLSYGEIAGSDFEKALQLARKKWDIKGGESVLARRVVRFRFPGLEEKFDDPDWGAYLRHGPLSRVGDMRIRRESYEDDIDRVQNWIEEFAPAAFRDLASTDIFSLPPFVHVIRSCHLEYI